MCAGALSSVVSTNKMMIMMVIVIQHESNILFGRLPFVCSRNTCLRILQCCLQCSLWRACSLLDLLSGTRHGDFEAAATASCNITKLPKVSVYVPAYYVLWSHQCTLLTASSRPYFGTHCIKWMACLLCACLCVLRYGRFSSLLPGLPFHLKELPLLHACQLMKAGLDKIEYTSGEIDEEKIVSNTH